MQYRMTFLFLVRATEGDAHPLGALPNGTVICHVEKFPGKGGFFCRAAGTCATLLRKIDDHVIVQLPDKRHVSLNEKCMAVVGELKNPSCSIGSSLSEFLIFTF